MKNTLSTVRIILAMIGPVRRIVSSVVSAFKSKPEAHALKGMSHYLRIICGIKLTRREQQEILSVLGSVHPSNSDLMARAIDELLRPKLEDAINCGSRDACPCDLIEELIQSSVKTVVLSYKITNCISQTGG